MVPSTVTPLSVKGPLSGEFMFVRSGMESVPVYAPCHSPLRPQMLEAKRDEFADHGGAAGFIEAGVARGINFFDHRQGKADLDDFQTLIRWYRRPATWSSGRCFGCL